MQMTGKQRKTVKTMNNNFRTSNTYTIHLFSNIRTQDNISLVICRNRGSSIEVFALAWTVFTTKTQGVLTSWFVKVCCSMAVSNKQRVMGFGSGLRIEADWESCLLSQWSDWIEFFGMDGLTIWLITIPDDIDLICVLGGEVVFEGN